MSAKELTLSVAMSSVVHILTTPCAMSDAEKGFIAGNFVAQACPDLTPEDKNNVIKSALQKIHTARP